MNEKRLFIALNLPIEVKSQLADLLIKLNQQNNTIKWCRPEGLHVTLHFLGYLNNQQEEQVKLIMQSSAGKFGNFEFKLGKINAFPNMDRPRVIYLECPQINGKSVIKLQSILAEKLIKINLRVDFRRWFPHLTLGRVSEKSDKFRFNYQNLNQLMSIIFAIDTFELMQSELTYQGPIYRQIISYKL